MFNRRILTNILISTIAIAAFTLTAAAANPGAFSFIDSVQEYFGVAPAANVVKLAPTKMKSPNLGETSGPFAPTAVLLSWNTFGNAGTETTEPSVANDPNLLATNLTLGSITAAANSNRFGGSNWFDTGDTNPTTLAESIAGNDYIQFVVTPNSGFSFTPTSFVFVWDKSGTSGPLNVTLRSSADSFATDLGTVTGITAGGFATQTITISGLSNLTTATTFRIYGYGATATTGTGGFDTSSNAVNVQLIGTTAATGTGKMAVTLPGQTWTSGTGNSGSVTPQTAGTPFNLTLTATQSDGVTTDTTYSGAKTISYSGPGGAPTYTTSVNFTSGQATGVAATLTQSQSTNITATDGTLTGVASSSLLVNPGAIASYVVTAVSPQATGNPFNTTVTAKDANNNTVTTDSTTVVTMTSGSGNMQFDSNGDTTFGDNTKALTSGTFTISTKDAVSETTTITATDGNSKTGTSGSITIADVTIASDYFRSVATGTWGTASTWESSHDGSTNWITSTLVPDFNANTITIRNGHTVSIGASVTLDQVVVESGGILSHTAGTVTVSNGTGNDIDVQIGGVFNLAVASGTPTFNASAVANISTGGILRVSNSGMTSNGAGVHLANFVYQNGSILEWPTAASAPSASGVTFFPNVNASTIPILRFTATPSNPGGGSNTVVNGVLEVTTGNTVTWTGAGTKTFRNGIRGAGTVAQGTAGQFIINGATADLGGGTLTLGTAGLVINNGTVATLSSNKQIDTNTITVNGTLNTATFGLTGSSAVSVGATGTLKGSGSVVGPVSVSGAISPGQSPGVLGTGNITFSTGSTLNEEIGGTTPGNGATNYDQLNVTGTVTLSGGSLNVTSFGGYVPAGGPSFVIINNDGVDPVSGTFTGLGEGATIPNFLGSGQNATISYIGGDGNDVVISVANVVPVVAVDDAISTGVNQTATTPRAFLLSNDSGTGLSITAVGNQVNGVVVLSGPNVVFTPDLNFVGVAGYDYTVSDGVTTDVGHVTVTVTDTTPPVIAAYTPIANSAVDTAKTLSVNVTDNVGVSSVSIFYSVGAGAPTPAACVSSGVNTYDCTIPAPGINSAVRYYVAAVDAAGNTATSPDPGSPNLYTIGGAAVPAGTYSNVSLTGGSTLGGNVTVNGDITLDGVVTGGAFSLTLGCDATVTGAGTGKYVNGSVVKNFCATTGTPFSYPVGQGDYTPVDVTITALGTVPSSLTIKSITGTAPAFNPEESLGRYWDLTENGDLTATLSFHYLDSDVNGTESSYRVWKWDGNGSPIDMCPSGPCVDTGTNTLGPIANVSTFSRWTGSPAGPLGPTASDVSVAGRVLTSDGRGIRNAEVTVSGNSLPVPLRALTGAFGYYQIDGLEAGETYVLTVGSKRFTFTQPSRIVSLTDNLMDADFVANP